MADDALRLNEPDREERARRPAFDIFFGILVPAILLIPGSMILRIASWQATVFLDALIGLGMLSFSLWLIFERRLGDLTGLVRGILYFGGMVSYLMALWMIPMGLLAIVVGIGGSIDERSAVPLGWSLLGLLAFAPFLTGKAFERNAQRARRLGNLSKPDIAAGAGVAVLVLAAYLAQWFPARLTARSMDRILHGTPAEVRQGLDFLRGAFWCTHMCYDPIVREYLETEDQARQTFLANVYFEITGERIQQEAGSFSD